MIDTCRKTIKKTSCESDVENQSAPVYEPFTACLPFGASLEWDGQGLIYHESANPISDGVYGTVTVQGNCISSAGAEPVCEYTPAPCAPAAGPCSGTGSGGAGVIISPSSDNLTYLDTANRLKTTLFYKAGKNISMSGSGTKSDPLVVSSVDGSGGDGTGFIKLLPGNSGVKVTGSGTSSDPYMVSHITHEGVSGMYGPFTLDEYGHVTGYNESASSVLAVMGATDIDVTTNGGIVTVALADQRTSGQYTSGGWELEFDNYGILRGTKQVISLSVNENDVYDMRDYGLSFNQYGSVVGITPLKHNSSVGAAWADEITSGSDSITVTVPDSGKLIVQYDGQFCNPPAGGGSGTETVNDMTVSVDGAEYKKIFRSAGCWRGLLKNLSAGDHKISISGARFITGVLFAQAVS